MLLELVLENGKTIECTSTNVSQQEFSTCLNISIKYTYQLPITHKMFEYFKIINHQFQEIVDEIDNHQMTSILISISASLFVDKDTLKKKHYIDLGMHHRVLNDAPNVVGYTCKDGTTIIDSLGLDAMTDGLQRLYDDYTSRAIFKRIPEDYREVVKLLPVKVKLIKGD
jgi:hypothetical protein